MYLIIVTKEILSGTLAGIIVEDKFKSSYPDDLRKVGGEYDGITHRYRVLDISSEYIKP
tara:strand:+ start:162 stop:338 length:177 start_codon:yes stop_codon:yes gene_type:complete